MHFLPVNSHAMLVELEGLAQVQALFEAMQADPLPGVEELVPAARTLLVRFQPATVNRESLAGHIAALRTQAGERPPGELVEIPVRYDGEDLDEVAQLLGLSREEVIRRHTGSEYSVAFTGFAPGFAYLAGGDPIFEVPRRATPRTRIPAGAVGLAGRFSGIYPQASPGGWQIIGVTDVPMWDVARATPALLRPGMRVRFVEQERQAPRQISGQPGDTQLPEPLASAVQAVSPASVAGGDATCVVRQPGLLALFQDQGRPGLASQGVSAAGALDQAALREANRLAGNAADTACIEFVPGGFEIECQGEMVVAVAGADVPLTLCDRAGRQIRLPNHHPLALTDGDRLTVGAALAGSRAYLAVRGGFAVAAFLGSRSSDTLARIGPPALQAGDRLPVLPARHGCVGEPGAPRPDLPRPGETVWLDLTLGPRADWFTEEALALLAQQTWLTTPQSNRVGIRLQGAVPLARSQQAELPSEGTVAGALQVPPSGQPVLFLADRPLTGGYPVIACVAPYHLDRAGQIPVGAQVRLRVLEPFRPIRPVFPPAAGAVAAASPAAPLSLQSSP